LGGLRRLARLGNSPSLTSRLPPQLTNIARRCTRGPRVRGLLGRSITTPFARELPWSERLSIVSIARHAARWEQGVSDFHHRLLGSAAARASVASRARDASGSKPAWDSNSRSPRRAAVNADTRGFGAIERNFWLHDSEDSRIIIGRVCAFDSKP
jgi:hypothetical protein